MEINKNILLKQDTNQISEIKDLKQNLIKNTNEELIIPNN